MFSRKCTPGTRLGANLLVASVAVELTSIRRPTGLFEPLGRRFTRASECEREAKEGATPLTQAFGRAFASERSERCKRSMYARNTNVRHHSRRCAMVGRLTLVPGGRRVSAAGCRDGVSRRGGRPIGRLLPKRREPPRRACRTPGFSDRSSLPEGLLGRGLVVRNRMYDAER